MGTFKTSGATGNREGLLDVLTYISRTSAPIFAALKRRKIASTHPEWLTQSLPTPTGGAANEGAAFSAGTITARSRTGAYTQILVTTYTISETQEVVSKAAVGSEVAEQKKLAYQDFVRDIEYELLNGTGKSGTSREIKGIRSWITTTVETGSGTGASETLTEKMFLDNLQAIWTQNGKPDNTYVGAFQKRKIGAFSGSYGSSSVSINVDQIGKKLISNVSIYESDFGILKIHLHDLATTTEVLNLQLDSWEVGLLRAPKEMQVLPGACDGQSFSVIAELALMAKAQQFNGKITGLATS